MKLTVTKRHHSSAALLASTTTRKSLPSYRTLLNHARDFREAQFPIANLNIAI